MNIRHIPFLEVFEDASGGNIKTPSSEFLEYGEIPVIDQGQSFIAGYVNDPVKICKSKPPVIIFGDHTKAIKYVDFHFAMGADGTKVLTPKNGNHAKYLFYALKALHIPDAGYSRHYKFLKETTIPLPPLAEQKRIAAILDAADALRTKRREALAQLDALLQSTFLTLFGDPVANPMGWHRNKLEAVCERVVDCPHSTPNWTESGVVCLRTSNLGKGEWNWTDTRYVTEEDYADRTKRSEVMPGDLVLSREGTVGVLALVEEGMRVCMGQRLVQLRANTSILSPAYLLFILLHDLAPERLGRLMAGSTSKHLNVKDLRKLSIPLPPLPLQQKFAAIVESVERQKAAQRAHLAELDALFAALQHRAFRGEL
jgi:type I restriction enzyme S subunit